MKKIILFCLSFIFLFPSSLLAQGDSLALSVTPPLININLAPKQEVATSIKVVNNNNRLVTVYVEAVDFRDQGSGPVFFFGDEGQAVDGEADKVFLSKWITLVKKEVVLQPFGSAEIPFVISVPEGANPGGHYAALLVGTNPPDESSEGAVVKISSKIACLILSRVAGDITEKGMIREFSVDKFLASKAENDFLIRFENLGNVHLRPQGTIKVFDIFGKQKGQAIDFNSKKDFGNVLPGGDRRWEGIDWKDEDFFLLNKYKAELSLSFGDEARQTDVRYVDFWVVDWKWLLIILVSLLSFFLLLIVIVKSYVKQSVKNLQRQIGVEDKGQKRNSAPARREVVDLRKKK